MYIQDTWICDDEGRRLILRGCNIGGSGKIPGSGGMADWTGNSTGGSRGVSFIGKPFPEEEADERFAELASWGFYFNRLVVPWEAIEHEGQGIYDEAYLAYLRKLLLSAEKHGVSVFIDPHQDVWGRAAGGDGAPSWTLEKLGINLSRLEAAGAILPRSVTDTLPPGDHPLMTWPAGNNRYAAATMFTLFFAGNTYAPETKVDGTPVQDWLQTSYSEAFAHAKRRLKNCGAIAGWGTMNEPHPGFIGYTDLTRLENNMVATGPMPSPFAAMAAASGHSVKIPVYTTGIFGVRQKGTTVLNPDKVSIFNEGFSCPWKMAGIWDDSDNNPVLRKSTHFAFYEERPAHFAKDFLAPFMDRFIRRLDDSDEKTLFFVEGVPAGIGTGDDAAVSDSAENSAAGEPAEKRIVNAFHWYDGPSLFIKQFRPWFNFNTKTGKVVLGTKAVRALYREQIASHIANDMPSLVGEFGIPFDLFKGRSFATGDYRIHEQALTMYYDALDDFLLGSCIWDYSPDNTFRWGDFWNNEDFSIVTRGNKANGQLLPRARAGWLRPYPLSTSGFPIYFNWNQKEKTIFYRYETDPENNSPTVLFIPDIPGMPNVSHTERPVITAQPAADFRRVSIQAEYKREERRLFVYHKGFDGEVEVHVQWNK